MDDVAHDRGVVQVLDGFSRPLDGGKDHFGNAQVLLVLGVVEDLHLFHLPVFLAHVGQEVFADVVIQLGEGDLLGGHRPHVELVDLERQTRSRLGPSRTPKPLGAGRVKPDWGEQLSSNNVTEEI